LLMMAFARNRKLAGPAGVGPGEIADRFGAGWWVVDDHADTGPGPAGPMRDVPRSWYRLDRLWNAVRLIFL
jgi:hypothetical protein